MAQYTTGKAAIGGDPAQLLATADTLDRYAATATELAAAGRRHADGMAEYWPSAAGAAYRSRTGGHVTTLDAMAAPLSSGARGYRTLAADLSAAAERAQGAMDGSVRLGLGEGDLVGNPGKVAMFVIGHPADLSAVAYQIGEVVAARVDAAAARNAFVTQMGGMQKTADEHGAGRRGSDDAYGDGDRADRVYRTPAGGRRDDNSSFDNDWAGRAILSRYLRGGDDWTIVDDENWSKYMMGNDMLAQDLVGKNQEQAKKALDAYLAGGGPEGTYDRTFQAYMENGESVVGYQYLHGTNGDVGGFHYQGTSNVKPRPDGTCEVTLDSGYTWNDIIDPNYEYTTDQKKSKVAEIITLGQADPYDMHITWHGRTTVVVAANGKVLDMKGYPAS
jgi:hypothetical protein